MTKVAFLLRNGLFNNSTFMTNA